MEQTDPAAEKRKRNSGSDRVKRRQALSPFRDFLRMEDTYEVDAFSCENQ
jgi:hypothetical protein